MGEQVAKPTPVVVTLPTEIDVTNSGLALSELTAALDRSAAVVIADMSGTTFCDTSGVRALLRAREDASARQVTLRFAIPPDRSVIRVLQLTGIIGMLEIYGSVDEAARGG